MKKSFADILHIFWGKNVDLRIRIFVLLAFSGFLISFIVGIVNSFAGAGLNVVLADFAGALLSLGLLYYALRTQNYRICYFITVTVIFLGLFPFLFLHMGGYHGGIITFMVFAVVFTMFLLEGKIAWLIVLLEMSVYTALMFYAYFNPEAVTVLANEKSYFISNLADLLLVCLSLGATMYAQIRLYRIQQQYLDEQNAVLVQVNHSKTQFLANTSHEMRTPLTVISVNIQSVMGILKRIDKMADDTEMQELLEDAQSEIMRLSRMVGGMLSLNSIADNTDKGKVDLSELINNTAEMMRLLLRRNNNNLILDIEEELSVYGNADLISQVVINLLQNSNEHSKSGEIEVSVKRNGNEITTSVKDNGSGISPALLPHVFERGVTDGGTGVGLFLCKTVIEAHGGIITADSEEGKGTCVVFNLPVYQGQYGEDE